MEKKAKITQVFEDIKKCLVADNTVSMPGVEECYVYKLNFALKSILSNDGNPNVIPSIESVIDMLWEDLNVGEWSKAPEEKRKLYGLASLFKVIRLVQELSFDHGCPHHHLKDAVKAADMGLLLGIGYHEQLATIARKLSQLLSEEDVLEVPSQANPPLADDPLDWSFPGISGEMIPIEKCPSLESFYKNYFVPKVPTKIQDAINHWPALQKWKDINYLVSIAGPRTVPIEIGSAYTEEDWGMKLIPFKDFVKHFICEKSLKIGYLAQHQLFSQVPELKNDIFVPEYTCFKETTDDDSDSKDVEINAWFGPARTVSPLHHDLKHNLLCQVVGRKRVLLYSPEDSENLYAHETTMLHNTSKVDPHDPNYEEFPKYRSAKAYECHLYPGEMLYIPPKWWHHVRSLDMSFSVSFWWE